MSGIDHYIAFLSASIILNITPGPDTLYILSRSIAQGKRAGVISALGIATGCAIHTSLAAFGLSMILATSLTVFSALKYAGAGYLVYLGVRALLRKQPLLETSGVEAGQAGLAKVYVQGVMTNLLNPKVALFFISFLPQFINPHVAAGPLSFIVLGSSFIITGTTWCLILVMFSAWITQKLRSSPSIAVVLSRFAGLVFIGLGLRIATTQR